MALYYILYQITVILTDLFNYVNYCMTISRIANIIQMAAPCISSLFLHSNQKRAHQ